MTRNPKIPLASSRDVKDRRSRLVSGGAALVEDSALSFLNPVALGHSSDYQVVVPYYGAFTWATGRLSTLMDVNRVLFVRAGEDFRETHPIAGTGHASLIVTPNVQVLEEMCRGAPVGRHVAFQSTSQPLGIKARLLTHRILNLAADGGGEGLEGDELAIAVLQDVLANSMDRALPPPARIVNQTKQILNARCCEAVRLDDLARELGVSGVYLTQSFTRSEGMPLYRYLMQLRLSRALIELPHRDSITDLALDLGFSSHSHFTAAFRASFGLTPSEFRASSLSQRTEVSVQAIRYPSSARR
nr:AraC family transcriptional regulator [Microvirga sp. ACRRW]